MTEAGRWAFDRTKLAPGPWIVLGWLGPWCCVRPLLVTVNPADGAATALRSSLAPADADGSTDTLEAAVREPSRELREAALDRILVAMSGDVNHPAWVSLEGFVATLGELPATTFDVIDRLIAHPAACAMALVVWGTTRFDALWYGLERLPFLWELVPARAWRDAVAVWARGALDGVPEDLRATVREALTAQLGALRSQVAMRSPSVAVALTDAARRAGITPTGDREYATVAQLLSAAPQADAVAGGNVADVTQRAWRAHADAQWPEWSGMLPALAELRAGVAPPLRALVPVPDDHRSPALAAPVYAALCAAAGAPVSLATLFELRRLREFDAEAWLDLHFWTTVRALARAAD